MFSVSLVRSTLFLSWRVGGRLLFVDRVRRMWGNRSDFREKTWGHREGIKTRFSTYTQTFFRVKHSFPVILSADISSKRFVSNNDKAEVEEFLAFLVITQRWLCWCWQLLWLREFQSKGQATEGEPAQTPPITPLSPFHLSSITPISSSSELCRLYALEYGWVCVSRRAHVWRTEQLFVSFAGVSAGQSPCKQCLTDFTEAWGRQRGRHEYLRF